VLRDFSLAVGRGEVLCLLGRNGAGKTTALKAIMGLVRPRSGEILMNGTDLTALPAHEIPRHGIGYVPQGRRLFSELTVAENLEIGLMARNRGRAVRDRAIAMFPAIGDRLGQRAGSLSGGEQQMLAMARALCLEPTVLLLDEPTEGLMPSMIARIREAVSKLRQDGVAIVLVEQRIDAVLPVAGCIAFIENGRIRETVPVAALKDDLTLVHRYVGVG
jgi:branched-chain amino acid transport system ATP-binding protein